MGIIKEQNKIILDYIKSNSIDLQTENLGNLSNKLRDLIASNTFDNSDDIIIEKTIFETTDKKIFNDKEQALNHQILTNQVNEIIELLGGNDLVDKNGFSKGEGYYLLDNYKLKLAGELSQSLQKELGLEDYPLTSKMCYENEYLGAISQTLMCIGTLENGSKVRLGQPYFVSHMNEVGDKIYNPEISTEISFSGNNPQQTYDSMMLNADSLTQLKVQLVLLRDEEDNDKIEELEINITNICEEILNQINDVDGNTNKEYFLNQANTFKDIYKEFVKNDDFLEDEHIELLKNIKNTLKEITLTLDINEEISPKVIEEIVDIPIEQIDLSKLKTKELIFELKNSLISGNNINEILDLLNDKIVDKKGIKEENYEELKAIYKEYKKIEDNFDAEICSEIKILKHSFKDALEEKNMTNIER